MMLLLDNKAFMYCSCNWLQRFLVNTINKLDTVRLPENDSLN